MYRRPPLPVKHDQFHLDQKCIPKGKAYQWIAIEVLGVTQGASTLPVGWKPVPFKRHAKTFPDANRRGRIVIDGLMLVEKPTRLVEAAAANSSDLNRFYGDLKNLCFSGTCGTEKISPARGAELPTAPYLAPPSGQSLEVEVTVKVRLRPNQVDAAAVCGISPEEYAQRVATMMQDGRIEGFLMPEGYGNSAAFVTFDKISLSLKQN